MKPRIVLAVTAALVSLACLPACQTAPPRRPLPATSTKPSAAVALYIKRMQDRLGPIWYELVKIHENDLDVGTVTITFELPAAGGKVRNVKIVSNTGGRMDLLIALRAIDQLRAPPIPPKILAELHQDSLVAEESFTVFPNP